MCCLLVVFVVRCLSFVDCRFVFGVRCSLCDVVCGFLLVACEIWLFDARFCCLMIVVCFVVVVLFPCCVVVCCLLLCCRF